MGLLSRAVPRGRGTAATPLLPGALPAGTMVGPWRVVRRLGGGGGGVVYLVTRWGRSYALKLALRPGDKRLVREGRMLRRVKHPGVVKLRASGWWLGRKEGFPYLVMEFVEGVPLYSWAQATRVTLRQVTELLAQAAEALEAVHRERSVHRDVKGANTLVRPGGQRLVLVDLGAGDYEGATPLTSHVLPPVTEVYLSPEAMAFAQTYVRDAQARYKARFSDDLYALGVMAHRVLTGEYPFPTHLPRDMFWVAVQARPAPDAHEENPRVPPSLAAIVLRLLAKRPQDRYASARQVAEALRQAAAEGGPEWDVPLFEAVHGPPLKEAQGVREGEPPEPDAPRSPSGIGRGWAEGAWRRGWLGAAVVAVLIGVGGGVALQGALTQSPTRDGVSEVPTQQVGKPGQEVAGARASPDAGIGAAPSEASTSAPAAPAAQLEEDTPVRDTSVTPPVRSLPPRVQKHQSPRPQPSTAGSGKLARIVPLCMGLACATPVVRSSLPPAEECPPGAWDAMAERGIRESDVATALFHDEAGVVSRKEGEVSVVMNQHLEKAPAGLILSGRIYFGEKRVYGRFTRAQKGDLSFPVCLELFDTYNKRGVEMEPGSTAETARFVNYVLVKAVERFE